MVKKKDKVDTPENEEELKDPTQEPGLDKPPDDEPDKDEDEDEVTLTKKELQDKISQAGIPLGRSLKTSEQANVLLKSTLDSQGNQITELQQTLKGVRDAARTNELERFKDTPDMATIVKARHTQEDREATHHDAVSKFNREKSELLATAEVNQKTEATNRAKELAAESGFSAEQLLDMSTDEGNDGKKSFSLKRMATLAKNFPKSDHDDGDDEDTPERKGVKALESGRGGGKSMDSFKEVEKRKAEGRATNAEYEAAAKKAGVSLT